MATYLANAFSLNMLPDNYSGNVRMEWMPKSGMMHCVRKFPDMVHSVGHEDTASLFSFLLDHPIKFNRIGINLKRGDILFVGQYQGPRLPEGCKQLPEGATIRWYKITLG